MFSHTTTTVNGLFTIRAYGVEEDFVKQFDALQDTHTAAWMLFLSTSRWFAFRLDALSATFVTCVTFSCIPAASGQCEHLDNV